MIQSPLVTLGSSGLIKGFHQFCIEKACRKISRNMCTHEKFVREISMKHFVAGLVQPLPIPTTTWADLPMDFLGGLPNPRGLDIILVVVDSLTKYTHFIPLLHAYSAKEVAGMFVKEVVWLHSSS